MYWFFVYHILFRVSLMTHFGSVLLMPVNPFRQICSVWCCLGRDCKSNSLQSYIPIIGHKFSRDYSNSPLFSCSLINNWADGEMLIHWMSWITIRKESCLYDLHIWQMLVVSWALEHFRIITSNAAKCLMYFPKKNNSNLR